MSDGLLYTQKALAESAQLFATEISMHLRPTIRALLDGQNPQPWSHGQPRSMSEQRFDQVMVMLQAVAEIAFEMTRAELEQRGQVTKAEGDAVIARGRSREMQRAIEEFEADAGVVARREAPVPDGGPPMIFKGPWARGIYAAGCVVQHKNTLWHAQEHANTEPGTSPQWRLMVRASK